MKPIAGQMPMSRIDQQEPNVLEIPATSGPGQAVLPSFGNGDPDAWLSIDQDETDHAAVGKQPIATLGRDDRKSSRSNVPPGRQACKLKVDSNVMSALVVDKSAGGFAVLVNCLDGLRIGKKAELQTDAGNFKIRVVYIKEVARPMNAPAGSDTWFRLGTKKQRSFFLF